ncbi:MAG TPA: DUF2510 domain-containing protein [Acidimicrobiales bacterium]|nr:DUF2510 domain-containing protein [Acidimicrobiales bacterium]
MASTTERTLDLDVPADAAFDATCRALASLGWALVDPDRFAGIVAARNPAAAEDEVALYVQPVTATSSTVVVRAEATRAATRHLDQIEVAVRQQAAIPVEALPPPPAAPKPGQPAGWYTDPAGRHEHRWWDGHRWTDAVSTAGVTATDPAGP